MSGGREDFSGARCCGSTTSASRRGIWRNRRSSTRMSSRWSASRRRRSSRRCSGFAWGTCSSTSSWRTAPRLHAIISGSRSTTSTPRTRRSRRERSDTWGWRLVELPSRQVQLYFRDPSDNLIELNWPDADTLDRSRYPELRRIADHVSAEVGLGGSRSLPLRRRVMDSALRRPSAARRRALSAAQVRALRTAGWTALARARRAADPLGALLRSDDREVRDELRLCGPRSQGLRHHRAQRRHRGGALLRRRERLHAHLRPDARRQHGARGVLPARRLRRAESPARHGRRRRLVRADERPGQPDSLDHPHARRDGARRCCRVSSCSSSSSAGRRARISARR